MWRVRKLPLRSVCSILKPYSLFNFTSKTGEATIASKPLMVKKPLEESDVGIFCYISQLPGFRGILKQRYCDFIVNEVDLGGNVVHLKSLDCAPEVIQDNETSIEDLSDKCYASEIELFRSLAGDSDAALLRSLIDQITSGIGHNMSHIVLSPCSYKSQRTIIHNFFKEHLKFLVTDTVDGPDASSKCIRVRLNSKGVDNWGRNSKRREDISDRPFDSRGTDNWPEHMGRFLRFNLYKENKDTQEALGVIGKMLGLPSRSFGFAGTKDKRSISTQRVTVYKQRANRVADLNKWLIGMKVGDFCYITEGLVLGQLLGNQFTIILRGVEADSEDTINAAADSLEKHGFINYFGLQRFGSGSVPTYVVGATLLRGEWKTAVSMILDPREGERDGIQRARKYFKKSGDIEGTLKKLPRSLVAERAILLCLKKCPGNYAQALKSIPRTLRMMYVHSYQSYLWNNAASIRVQKYGTDRIVLGDLVYCNGDDIGKAVDVVTSECEDEDSNDSGDYSHFDEISRVEDAKEKYNFVKAITNEDIISGKYSIDDVVLPMPGSKIIYPENDIAEVYHELAKKDSISLTGSGHNVKEFSITSMTGSYRRVFQKPMDFEWELLTYTDSSIPLVETDLDNIIRDKSMSRFGGLDPDSQSVDKPESKYVTQQVEIDTDRTVMSNTESIVKEENRGNGGRELSQKGCMRQSERCSKMPLSEPNLDNDDKLIPMNLVKEDNKAYGNGGKCELDSIEQEKTVNAVNNSTDNKAIVNRSGGLAEADSICTSITCEIQRALKLSFSLPASCYATMAVRELLKTSTSVSFHRSLITK